ICTQAWGKRGDNEDRGYAGRSHSRFDGQFGRAASRAVAADGGRWSPADRRALRRNPHADRPLRCRLDGQRGDVAGRPAVQGREDGGHLVELVSRQAFTGVHACADLRQWRNAFLCIPRAHGARPGCYAEVPLRTASGSVAEATRDCRETTAVAWSITV